MAICWQIRRQNLIPRFLPANQHTSKSSVQRMEGGRARGGANFLCLSPEFAELHRHKQAHTYTQRLAWSRAVSVAFSHPEDTTEKTLFRSESWNEFTACFLHICLSFFFLNSFYPAPEPSQHTSAVSAPLSPPLSASSPGHFCMHCRGKCYPAVHAASIYHDAVVHRCAASGVRPKINIKPEPTFPQLSHQRWTSQSF